MQNLKFLRKQKTKARQIERLKERLEECDRYEKKERELSLNEALEEPVTDECPFDLLSDELMLHIFSWIPLKKLVKLSAVSRRWHKLINDESLWGSFDLTGRTVNAVAVMNILNRGVRILGLAQTDIRKSISRNVTKNDSCLKSLPAQLDFYLYKRIKIEYLDLTFSNIDVNSLNILLKHCRFLKKLSIESLTVDNQTFYYLSTNKQLNTLNLCQCNGIQLEGLVTMLESLKMLEALNISWAHLSRESVVALCKYLPKTLLKLNIAGCKTTIFDSDVDNLVVACPNLIELDLSDSQYLTCNSVEKIANSLHKLEEVSFSRCYSIKPSSYFFLGNIKTLIALNLHNILKNSSFDFMKGHIPTLKYFNACLFSSIARARNGNQKGVVWNYRIIQNLNSDNSF